MLKNYHRLFAPAVILSLFLLSASGSAADPSTLYDLNKLGINGFSKITGNCDGGTPLTDESRIYCAIKNVATDGSLGFELKVGAQYTKDITKGANALPLYDAADYDTKTAPTFEFPTSGKKFSILFLDRNVLHLYLHPDETPGAAFILRYFFDEATPATFNKECQIQSSKDGRAIAFKNCSPNKPDKASASKPGVSTVTRIASASALFFDSGPTLYFGPTTAAIPTPYEIWEKIKLILGISKVERLPDTVRFTAPARFGSCIFDPPVKNAKISGAYGTNRGDHIHAGVDLIPGSGDFNIYAPSDGVVSQVFRGGDCGNGLRVAFPSCAKQLSALFCHFANGVSLKEGQRVTKGQVIGKMGGTGNANGAVHLHYSVSSGCESEGCSVNPAPFLANGYQPGGKVATERMSRISFSSNGFSTISYAPTVQPASGDVEKTGIYAITGAANGQCQKDPKSQAPYSGGTDACIYFHISKDDGQNDKFYDVAFAGYGNDHGGCFAVRSSFARPELFEGNGDVAYPTSDKIVDDFTDKPLPAYEKKTATAGLLDDQRDYKDLVSIAKIEPNSDNNFDGNYVSKVPVRQNFGQGGEDNVKGLVMQMFIADNKDTFSVYTRAEGIKRRKIASTQGNDFRFRVGQLSCQTFTALPAAAPTQVPLPSGPVQAPKNTQECITMAAAYSKQARAKAPQYCVPHSVTIAQALQENGINCNSQLNLPPNNNYFGIKASAAWKGAVVNFPTQEEGPNGRYTIRSNFRKYTDPSDSFLDHAKFFYENGYREATAPACRSDYTCFAKAIKAAGYATDSNYANALLGYIKQYKLDQYDEKCP